MKKKLKTSLFHHAACISLALMAVLLAFAACKDEPEPLSGANNITSFKIGDRGGAITRTRGETELVDQDSISVIVPATVDLKSAKPVITISGGAKVSPASEEAVDLTYPLSYVVTAENGSARFYKVTANVEVTDAELDSIRISRLPLKVTYTAGESLSLVYLEVTGNYADGTTKDLPVAIGNISGYDKDTVGIQTLTITINDKTAVFNVEVVAAKPSSVAITKTPSKTSYLKGEDLDLTGIIVTVEYPNASLNKILDADALTPADIIGYDKNKIGSQQVYVKIDGKTSSSAINVTVYESSPLSLTIGLPKDDNGDLNIYGIPEDGIQLSVDGKAANGDPLPKLVVISVGAANDNVYSSISWYIDGTQQNSWPNDWNNTNIVTVAAAHTNPVLTLNKTHTLTVEVTKDNGVVYSQTIPFQVVK